MISKRALRLSFFALCDSIRRARALLLFIVFAQCALGATGDRTRFPQSLAPISPDIARTIRTPTAAYLAQTMEFQVPLRMRNFDLLQQRIGRGEVVPRSEMDSNYFPTHADYLALKQWLIAEGFRITLEDPSRLGIFAEGTLAQIQRSFQLEMVEVTVKGRDYHAARTDPTLPQEIASTVLGVNGLQPYLQAVKHLPILASLSNHSPPYMVSEILNAYNATNLGVSGSGQTIAILIDKIANTSDLTTFWANNSVTRTGTVETINVNNVTLGSPGGEETLDEEWTSGIAPGAKIRVYATGTLAWTGLDKGLIQIINDLPNQPGLRQLSISMGLGEAYMGSSQMNTDSQYMATLASNGVSVFVSSGDGGSNPTSTGVSGGATPTVEYYSSDPSVTGVGGTSLTLDAAGNPSSETAWAGSGGGVSTYFSRPSWQVGASVPSGTKRLVPDVALVADPNTGAYVILNGGVYQYGGTSLSAPIWAGFCALANEARSKVSLGAMGLLNPRIYPFLGTSNFRDVTSGNNGAYSSAAGYDQVTGLGVPVVNTLIQTLMRPLVSGFSPTFGVPTSSVTLSGFNYANVSSVTFNGVTAAFTVDTEGQITATVPGSATSGPVVVTTALGSGTSTANFTVNSLPSPSLSLYAPTSGTSGSTVTLTGSNFLGISAVTFNGVAALFTVSSSTQITAIVPAAASTGPIAVINASGSSTGTGVFFVTAGSVTNTIFSTAFETSEGYPSSGTLAGQKGWVENGSGGTGFKTTFFTGEGHAAYLGSTAPTSGTVSTLWQPLNHVPAPGEVVTFSVLMEVKDSTNPRRDAFRWSVRNSAQTELFAIEFNNSARAINYVLDDGSVISTGWSFSKSSIHILTVSIDFSHDLWSANVDSSTVAANLPVTTTGAPLDLGAIDAVWILLNSSAGSNYLAFDNYSVTANVPQFSISATASPSNGGTISGAGLCNSGSTATLLASPNTGFVFTSWSEGDTQVSSSSSYSLTPISSRAFTANFVTAYSVWGSRYFTASELAADEISGSLADPDHDGIPNLLCYAFNSNPKAADRSVLPRVAVENGYLTLTYNVNPDATDLAYIVEVSTDCVSWQSGTGYTSSPVAIPATNTVKVTDRTPIATGTRHMMRLRVLKP